MSHLLQLIPTRAGYALENAALAGDGPAPRLDRMIVGGGTPLADPASATAANIGTPLAVSVQAVRMVHSADAITGDAGFPEAGTYTITWAALLFDDGTPAAYGAFTAPFEKGAGWAYSLEWVLSRTGVGNLSLTVNIVDVNALAENVAASALDSIERQTGGIVAAHVTPIARAMQHVLRDGSPLMHLELFADPYNLRGGNALAISGVIAGDDSIDLAESTETMLSGDYLIFGGGNTETVRLLANLELGRRRLQSDILHTYPTATLSRTNWTITAGEAITGAGQVYYSKPLPLADNARTHRVIIRALSAAAAPVVAMRSDSSGDYSAGTLKNTRPAADGSADYSDYLYDVVCGDGVGHLRITTPAATRVRAIVLASVEHTPSIYDIAADPERERLRYERGGFLGIFGRGEFVALTTPGDGLFIVPEDTHKLRVRVVGGGTNGYWSSSGVGHGGGHGGGFAVGVIDVSPGQSYSYVVSDIGAYHDVTVNGNQPIQSIFSDESGPLLFARAGWGSGSVGQPGFGGGRCAMQAARGGRGAAGLASAGGGAAGSQLGDGGNSYSMAGAAVGGMHAMQGSYAGASPYSSSDGWTPGRDFFGGTSVVGDAAGHGSVTAMLGALMPRFPGDWFPGAGGYPGGASGIGGPGAGGGSRNVDFTGGGGGGVFGGGSGAGNNPGVGGSGAGGGVSGGYYAVGGTGLIVIEW